MMTYELIAFFDDKLLNFFVFLVNLFFNKQEIFDPFGYSNNFVYCNQYKINLLFLFKGFSIYNPDWLILFDILNSSSDISVNNKFPFFKNYILYIISIIWNYIAYLFLVLFYLFLFLFLYKSFIKALINNFNITVPDQFYFEIEHNVGDGENLLMLISLILAILLFNLFFVYNYSQFLDFYIVYCLIILTFVVVPLRIIIAFGSNFITYIKGSSTYSKFSLDIFNDAVSCAAFLIRFGIQSVRIILVYIFYFSFHEYVFVLPKTYLTNIINIEYVKYYHVFYTNLFFLRWILELVDSTISICNQIASFFFVIFWLFSYINTVELKKKKIFWFNKLKITICFPILK